jgi:hypothetical protein
MNGHFTQEAQSHRTFARLPAQQTKEEVDIRPLKSFVFERFPKDSTIYDVFFTEQDLLGVSEFLAKVDVWLKLAQRIRR